MYFRPTRNYGRKTGEPQSTWRHGKAATPNSWYDVVLHLLRNKQSSLRDVTSCLCTCFVIVDGDCGTGAGEGPRHDDCCRVSTTHRQQRRRE